MYSKFAPARYARAFNNFPSLFEDVFFGKDFHRNVPAVNIHEDEKKWNIEVSAAGFSKEDFRIALENDVLTISAEHKTEVNEEEKNYSRREFSTTSFTRSFRLKKEDVNEENISASYDNGILNIAIPKAEEAKKETVKEIKIG
ncbi:MAG TPA: Hsp20/alpha crystallin family protein [Bacteroidia bacterium]|jgi:HSP20 family protein|nr:Hsp20/alpha crystallin family protein [Bacteroidia bacterium]